MAIIERDFYDSYEGGVALALGYFDSVHIGHCSLIQECSGSELMPAVFTFRNNPDEVLGGSREQCYTYSERVQILERLGVGLVISADFDDRFMQMRGGDFLGLLLHNFNVKKLVIGSDFHCGYHAEYGVEEILHYCEGIGVEVIIKNLLEVDGTKVASRNIRRLISNGEVDEVNRLLPFPYSVTGQVCVGRRMGGKIGFPTANIPYPKGKVRLLAGVYASYIYIDGVRYRALTNVGEHPTFDDYVFNIESFILDFSTDIYGKTVRVEFVHYMRGVVRFDSVSELCAQITSDVECVRNEVKL